MSASSKSSRSGNSPNVIAGSEAAKPARQNGVVGLARPRESDKAGAPKSEGRRRQVGNLISRRRIGFHRRDASGATPRNNNRVFAALFKKLPRSFYLRPTLAVAKDLLGKYFVRRIGRKRLIGKIVEVEAYCERDPASHSYRGVTERNKVMFEEGGHLYVYFTYGKHFCANVVTREEGVGEAVLIRAVEPVVGIGVMQRNRWRKNPDQELTDGPAKFCEAFGIDRSHNGIDLCGTEIWIAASPSPHYVFRIQHSTRVGIRSGREKKWRFSVKGSRFVSI